MGIICSWTYFETASCTRVAILDTMTFYCDGGQTFDLNFEASFAKQDCYFPSFLPAMASNHTSMNYNGVVLKNHGVHKLLVLCSSAQTCWQCVGPKFHSLLSAHHLIGAYFLTTESNKHDTYLTRLYSMSKIKPLVLNFVSAQSNNYTKIFQRHQEILLKNTLQGCMYAHSLIVLPSPLPN